MNNEDNSVTIIAGPCSISTNSVNEIFRISDIRVKNQEGKSQQAIWGVRVVGLKSRTKLKYHDLGMGIDFDVYSNNVDKVLSTGSTVNLDDYPSVKIAKQITLQTNLVIASEIVDPLIQLPVYEHNIPKSRLFIWNPAVNQLGYQMRTMGIYAERNSWYVGIKNPKWYGHISNEEMNSMESSWIGQLSYAKQENKQSLFDKIVMIHRGVDVVEKGSFRNLPVHDSAIRVKKHSGQKMFFDPSHSLGPLLRDTIVDTTIQAMRIKTCDDKYLYDGVLIESGTSETDTEQHISLSELQLLCDEISKFRNLVYNKE